MEVYNINNVMQTQNAMQLAKMYEIVSYYTRSYSRPSIDQFRWLFNDQDATCVKHTSRTQA